jgi:hypothetical protein
MTLLNKLARFKTAAPAFVLPRENLWKVGKNKWKIPPVFPNSPHQKLASFAPLEKPAFFPKVSPGSFRVFHHPSLGFVFPNRLQINILGARKALFPQLRQPYTVKAVFLLIKKQIKNTPS